MTERSEGIKGHAPVVTPSDEGGPKSVRPGFHLAIPVDDIGRARAFYGGVLGLPEGRSSDVWVDWNFYGHQVVTHRVPVTAGSAGSNPVDGHDVPVPHFGLILPPEDFHALAGRLRDAGVEFVIEPYVRFAGEPGEQWTMFLRDPAGNALEFKAFADESQLFAK
ncbi:VOC family protein [Actinoallomurus oryzae]|uniref:VOC family protein n=1 Tax=Actinoallomurus oryzae TaxID=502180 RepID=A0ABP8QDD0_9ACTN